MEPGRRMMVITSCQKTDCIHYGEKIHCDCVHATSLTDRYIKDDNAELACVIARVIESWQRIPQWGDDRIKEDTRPKNFIKKYLLFAGHSYYPEGGFNDFRKSFDSVEYAKKWFGLNHKKISISYIDHWGHVVDRDNLKIVARFKQGFSGTTEGPIVGPVIDDDA